MLHPVLHLLATRPQWVAEHAEAYAELAAAELAEAAAAGRRTLMLGLLAVCAWTLAVGLAGVALMLWAQGPAHTEASAAHAWLLWAVPLLPASVGAGALAAMASRRRGQAAQGFGVLRQQWQADLSLLREAAAP